jgi:hypothetical protein
MRKIFAVLGAAGAMLVSAAPASAAVVPVNSLSGDFSATNPSVRWTPQGVNYGVYADAGRAGGSLEYDGLNGQPLSAITNIGFVYNFNTSDGNPIAAPYLRIFFIAGGVDQDIILDPTECATVAPPQNADNAVSAPSTEVRLNDDGCADVANSQMTLAEAIAAAGPDAAITGIFVTQGFSGGTDASAFVRNLTVNGTTFAFNVPPAAGPPGPTTVVQAPPANTINQVVANQVNRQTCRGNKLRQLHAPKARRGQRFLRVAAALRTTNGFRPLKVKGRTITVDLRNRPEANYNVRLISRYRTRGGKVRRIVTRRHLSVACS